MSIIEISQAHKEAFERKRETCKARAIDFDFTLEEFDIFLKLKKRLVCAYSGQPFVDRHNHPNSPTVERINNHKSYSVENCVWVTSKMNEIKAKYIENERSMKGVGDNIVHSVQRINKILNNQGAFDEMMKPYRKAYEILSVRAQEKLEKEKKMIAHNKSKKAEIEREVAKSYYQFSSQLAEIGVPLEMTMPEYRRKLLVKTCRLTGRELPKDLNERTLFVADKTAPVTAHNVKTTTKEMQKALDTFTASAKISPKIMTKIAKEMLR